jgi:hypothetical protein
MVNKIPVDTLYYTTIVAKDAKALARNHAEFYGINKWKVVHATPERLKNKTLRGQAPRPNPFPEQVGKVLPPNEFGFISALGSNATGGVTFQIIQPAGGLSTFEEFLVTRGSGVHSVFMSEVQAADFPSLKDFLAREGVPVAQSFTIDDAADFYYFDTRKLLGGFYVQVVVPRTGNWRDGIRADETWDFSAEVSRPQSVSATTKAAGVRHFGVIVHDVVAHTRNFARLFGVPVWRGMHWRTESGSLENTTCNGKPVIHAYFTGRGDVGKTGLGVSFGFEIVQPTFGPSHYKEDFLQVLGPGIHHVDVSMPIEDWSEWEAINKWLTELSAPTCMSGELRGGLGLFHYQDTRRRLGYVSELIAPPKTKSNAPRVRWAPDYWYDFTAELVQ